MTTTSSTEPTMVQTMPRGRIVVIEDDSVLSEVIRELLVDEGFDVRVCNRGENGHACVVAGQPDLVMLDLRFGDEEYGWRILDQLILDRSRAVFRSSCRRGQSTHCRRMHPHCSHRMVSSFYRSRSIWMGCLQQ